MYNYIRDHSTMTPVIVIPAFSRQRSLARLLRSIKESNATNSSVKIIISLDGGYCPAVLEEAESFILKNPSLDVELVKRDKNIGLKNHILWCGDLVTDYGSVIILEDDLVVAKDFYEYAKSALNFYENEGRVGGVSLYGQRYNEYSNLPFEPMPNGSDTYFMQVASSWGQAWSRKQWLDFKNWFIRVDSEYLQNIIELPSQVSNWPETSWKKFYSAYLVEERKYFVYPFVSRTSNCADTGGQHTKLGVNYLQVPLSLKYCHDEVVRFCNFSCRTIKYDAFMEAIMPKDFQFLGVDSSIIAIDLYGLKPKRYLDKYRYVITSKGSNSALVDIPLKFKPMENNIFFYNECNSFDDSDLSYIFTETKFVKYNKRYQFVKYSKYFDFYSYFKISDKRVILSYVFKLLFSR